MKLDIEAMAREAGAVKERDETFGTAYEFELPQLETFARRIVERCAQEAEAYQDPSDGAAVADSIRNLLEDRP